MLWPLTQWAGLPLAPERRALDRRADADLFPDEQIEAIANRLGFGDALTELLES